MLTIMRAVIVPTGSPVCIWAEASTFFKGLQKKKTSFFFEILRLKC